MLLFSDWTDEDPMRVFTSSSPKATITTTTNLPSSTSSGTPRAKGTAAAIDKRKMWNEMRMNPTDLADLSAATLTYLANGVTPPAIGRRCSDRVSACGCAWSTVRATPSTTYAFPD